MDLLTHLTRLDAGAVADLLRRRRDVLRPPAPADLTDLAARLDDPRGLRAALDAATRPTLQVTEVLCALGGSVATARLAELLGVSTDDATLRACLEWLRRHAVVRPAHDDSAVIEASPGVLALFERPLNLGPHVADLLVGATGEWAKRALSRLGVTPPGKPWTKASALAALTDVLTDPDRVRAVVATAPATVQDWLVEQAWGRTDADTFAAFSRNAYAQRSAAQQWASERALVIAGTWDYQLTMPGEVALAVRGRGYRAPFTPRRPDAPTHAVDPQAVESAGAAAAAAFDGAATAVLDRLRGGLTGLKSGGVGVRELRRLAASSATSLLLARVVLELVAAAGAVDVADGRLVPGPGYTDLREAEPAERVASLLAVWYELPFHPGLEKVDDQARPALLSDLACLGCRASRSGLVSTLADLPERVGSGRAAIARVVAWRSPLGHPVPDGDPSVDSTDDGDTSAPYVHPWREAEMLGVIALGSATALGRALVDRDAAALHAAAVRLLPPSVDDMLLGADATAVVTGAPSARLTRLLDACADRESRGAGAVWRLTAGSIRRALDAGTNADELASALEAASRTGLPATTRVLIDDVARRHGSLRLRPATSVLHSADAPLLAQAVADRSLARLGLSLLAPTVATCTAPVAEALAALRKAGYLPMPEDAAGVVQVAEGPGRLPARQATPAGPGDGEGAARGAAVEDPLATLAGALVAAGRGSTKATGTEADLLAAGSRLSRTENRMLAQAVDDGAAVTIEYVSTTGSMSSRMVSDLQLEGTTLWGWCELRNGEQDFTVSRIVGVAPAL